MWTVSSPVRIGLLRTATRRTRSARIRSRSSPLTIASRSMSSHQPPRSTSVLRLGPRSRSRGEPLKSSRPGAIGDIRFVDLDDDLLVVAGDNLFDYSLADYEDYWRERDGSCVAVFDVGDRELAKRYGIVEVDADDRVVGFVEKPEDPPTTLCATATYLYGRDHLRLVERYLEEGNPPDKTGNYVAWQHEREPVT